MKENIKFNLFNLFVFDGATLASGEAADAAIHTTDTPALSPTFKTYYSKRLIRKAGPDLVYAQFAETVPLPEGNGKSIEFRGFKDLDTDVNSRYLEEGKTPNGQKLEQYSIVATLVQVGGYVTLDDMVMTVALDPMLTNAVDKLSAQAAVVLDKIIRNTISADEETVNVCAGGHDVASEVTAADTITVADIRKMVTYLKRVNAPKINGAYPLILHPDVTMDLMATEEWKEMHRYACPENMFNGYVGDVAGAKIYESTNALIMQGASGVACYVGHLVAKGAYATVSLSGGALKSIIKPLGSAGSADPLDQRGTAGWKASTATKVLIPEYIVCYHCASTMNATDEIETV